MVRSPEFLLLLCYEAYFVGSHEHVFHIPGSLPFLASLVLFFAAACMMYYVDYLILSRWWAGGQLASWSFSSMLLRRLLAMLETNSKIDLLFSSLLTFIFSQIQSCVFWPWSLRNSYHRFEFQSVSGDFIFWGHLTCEPICLITLKNSGFDKEGLEVSVRLTLSFHQLFLLVSCGILHDSYLVIISHDL